MKNSASVKNPIVDEFIKVRVEKAQKRFKRVRVSNGPDVGVGEFFLLINVTALAETVYIPLSIASGKKPTGFVYQIEGTSVGSISTTSISCGGDGITQISLGTILYSKIPKGMTATFRVLIEMKGQMEKSYKIVISRVHYKLNPSDARYQRFLREISTPTLKFH